MKIFQAYNKKTCRWVKIKKYASGQTEIIAVKKKLPSKPFKGVKRK